MVVLGRGAISEIALCLVMAERADPLHVAQQQRPGLPEPLCADAELLHLLWQLVTGAMVERLHADMAKRTIEIADAIAAMGKG